MPAVNSKKSSSLSGDNSSSIGAFSYIENSIVQENCDIKSHVVITNSTVQAGITVNPFTQINNQCLTNFMIQQPTKNFTQSHDYSFTAAIKNSTDLDSLSS